MTPQNLLNVQRHRDALVRAIARKAVETTFWTGREQFSDAVMAAIARVARHAFIPGPPALGSAYANTPQPIGLGQTISQPYIVALMTDLLDLSGSEWVLEIGTGSGYQSAVLAELGVEVYTVERHEELAQRARATLKAQGYASVQVLCADGTRGWPEYAPYDAILVTAATDGPIPKALIEQLAPGGSLVVPLGPRSGPQMLTLGRKNSAGQFASQAILPVAFVPLVSPRFIAPLYPLENSEKVG